MEEEHLSRRQAGASDAGGSPSTSGRSGDDDGSGSEPDVDMQVPGNPAAATARSYILLTHLSAALEAILAKLDAAVYLLIAPVPPGAVGMMTTRAASPTLTWRWCLEALLLAPLGFTPHSPSGSMTGSSGETMR